MITERQVALHRQGEGRGIARGGVPFGRCSFPSAGFAAFERDLEGKLGEIPTLRARNGKRLALATHENGREEAGCGFLFEARQHGLGIVLAFDLVAHGLDEVAFHGFRNLAQFARCRFEFGLDTEAYGQPIEARLGPFGRVGCRCFCFRGHVWSLACHFVPV